MNKRFIVPMTILIAGAIVAGFTIRFEFPNVDGEASEHSAVTKGAPQIEVNVEKNYEDGIDLKASLQNVKTAKGKWKIMYCGLERIRNNAGASTIVGFGFSDCPIIENQEVDYMVYANFTGVADGKQITIDKVYELTPAKIDQVPLEGESPTNWDSARILAETGVLDNFIPFGTSKAEVRRFASGYVIDKGNELIDEGMIYSFDSKQRLIGVTFIGSKDFPISEGMDEIETDIGAPASTNTKAGMTYYTYTVNGHTIVVVWSNVDEEIRQFKVSK